MRTSDAAQGRALTDVLFEDASVGRCLVAPDGTVVRVNAAWLRSTGFDEERVVGEKIVDLFPETRDLALAMHARARAGHRVEVPRHAQVVNGRETWWEGSIDPVSMERGVGLLITAREVSTGSRPPPVADGDTRLADYLRDVGPAGIVLFEATPPFRVLSTNRAYLTLWPEPFRSQGLVGRALTDFIPDAEESGVAEVFRDVAGTRAARHLEEFPYRLADGQHWFNWSLIPVIREGAVVALANMAVDITREVLARKEVERARDEQIRVRQLLEAERARWRGIVEGIADEVWVCDAAGRMDLINLPDVTAMGLEQFEGKTIQEVLASVDIFYPDGRVRPPEEAPLLRSLRTGEVVRGEEIMRHRASGRVRHRQFSCAPTRDEAGRITGAVAIARDVTAMKLADQALRKRETEFRALIEELRSGVALIDASGKFSLYNARFLELFGLRPDADVKDVNDQDWAEWQVFDERGVLLPVDDHPVRRAALTRTRVRNQLVAVRPPRGGPELKWLLVSAEPLLAEDGSVERIVCTYHEVTEQHRVEEALRDNEQRLRALADSMPQLAWTARGDGSITWYNRRWYEYTGTTPEQMEGWGWQAVHDPAALPAVLARWKASIATGTEFEMEFPLRGADGRYRRFLTRVFPLKDGDGTVLQWFGTNTDVTDLVEAQEALREAGRRKDEFLGMLSHELRNPLAPIRNSTFILQHAAAGSEQARRAQTVIQRQTEHLTRLVDDLLDVTRIARGRIELRRSRVDLRDVVARAAEDFRVLLHDRGVRFETTIPDEKLWADADATRITQIVGNLLHNASKFTRRGDAVTLAVEAVDGAAEIRVRDTGAGIEPELLPRVFDPFVQGERTLARTEGGLGLGLALVKGITALHGGAVRARSDGKGHGSEFVVTLPLCLGPDVRSRTAAPQVPRSGGRRVLVVDDNTDAADSLADLVRMLGHDVDIAYDGPTAIEKVRANTPSLVFCDLGLPGMSGYEVATRLRDITAGGVQLFAVSGYAQPEDVQRAIDAGFDGHVAKPCDPEKIARLLE